MKILSKVQFAYFGVVNDVGGRTFGDDMALANDIGPLADRQGFANIVVCDQDADIF